MYFVGHTRFSLYQPQSPAWALSREVDYRDYLYSEERMRPRLSVFLGESLRLLRAASQGHNVRHVVSYSPEMPSVYKRELIDVAIEYPWIILDECVVPGRTRNVNREAQEMMHGESGIYATYRLDDDDLLPVDYFDQMAAHVRSDTVGSFVSLGRGATAIFDDLGFGKPREARHRMYSAGLLSVCRSVNGSFHTPPRYVSHNRVDEVAPVVVDSRRLGFVWTRTLSQDTALVRGHVRKNDLEKELSHLDFVDPLAVEASFPGVF